MVIDKRPTPNVIVKKNIREAFQRGFNDPVAFAEDFIGLSLHPAQQKFLRESTKEGIKEANLSAGNRFGKGEVAAVKLLWSAFYQKRNENYAFDAQGKLKPYTAINTSISLDQASIVFNKAAGYAQNSPNFKNFVDRVINSPFPTMILKAVPGKAHRGAEIWARSLSHGAKYLLGQNFQYLNIDEASLEPNGEVILNDVIRMRMADSGGNIDTTSQPRGKNWWYHHVMQGFPDSGSYDPAVYSQYGESFDNPFIDHNHIRRSMERMTEGQVLENIRGRFSDDHSFFPADRLAVCYKDQDYKLPIKQNYELTTRFEKAGDVEIPVSVQTPIPDTVKPIYVMGVDLAAKYDETCIIVMRVDCRPFQMVHFEMFGRTDWRVVKMKVANIHKQYNAWGYVDSTGPGGPVFDDLIGPDFNCNLEGFNFSGTSGNKLGLLTELQMAIQATDFVFPNYGEGNQGTQPLINQLLNYQLDDKRLATDAVFGLALCIQAARDAIERENTPAIYTPDLPTVIARRDPRTGMYMFDDAHDEDEEDFFADKRFARYNRFFA